ncbi:MAG TPA: RsmD family RNA methyltransferase [Thermoanaerobaculaceae bacterium]|nr:RsmD family RNA methyltransferase [Thermoanaerobaculaceae bacterium]HRS17215.1 RsmD family RNA methyltransferase [Thermoanaerobaculaceae bacterium]
MRITGGAWRSRTVAGPPRGAPLRPTPDALREQAFGVLSPHLAGAVFLDLFAGTGAVSLEALSRGAALAVLCEQARTAQELIRRNFAGLGVPPEAWELHPGPVARSLPRLAARGLRATLAWCDPPFADWEAGLDALALAASTSVLAAGALVVLELPPKRTVALAGFETARPLRGAVLLRKE